MYSCPQQEHDHGACPHCQLSPNESVVLPPIFQSAFEINQIVSRSDLQLSRDILAQVTSQIEALTAAIKRLQSFRSRLADVVTKHASFFAPINQLPNDILSIILEFIQANINWSTEDI